MPLSPSGHTPRPTPAAAHLPGQGLPQQLGGLGGLQQADAPHDGAQGDAGPPRCPQQPPAGCLLLAGLRGRQRGGQRGQDTRVPRCVLLGVRCPLGCPGLPQAAVPAATDLSISTWPRPLLGATPTRQGGVSIGSSPISHTSLNRAWPEKPHPLHAKGCGHNSPALLSQRGVVSPGPTHSVPPTCPHSPAPAHLPSPPWPHPAVPTLSPPTWRSGCPGRSRAGA